MPEVGFWDGVARSLTAGACSGGRFKCASSSSRWWPCCSGSALGSGTPNIGRKPFLLRVVEPTHDRWPALKQGLRDAIIPLCVAFVIDGILQRMLLGRVRPLAAVIVGALLVFLPFVIARGTSNRIWTLGRVRQIHGRRDA